MLKSVGTNVLDLNVKCGDNRHGVDHPAKFPYKK